MEAAKQLTPNIIGVLPADELHCYLGLMDSSGQALPSVVQGALISLHVGRALQAAEHSDTKFTNLIDTVRPWPEPSESNMSNGLGRETWKLRHLAGITEQQRSERFVDTVVKGFMVKLLETGAERSQSALAFAPAIQECWNANLDDEVGDHTTNVVDMCVRCARSVIMLVSFDFQYLDADAFGDLAYIEKRRFASGSGIDIVFSICISETEWYAEPASGESGHRAACSTAQLGCRDAGLALQHELRHPEGCTPHPDHEAPVCVRFRVAPGLDGHHSGGSQACS